ncbi:MAG: hypothetical protein KTR18_05590 [Acidiferrobacterales bacterium]|nr:hypothetical protein [Acidiferrobacterales bacterium]
MNNETDLSKSTPPSEINLAPLFTVGFILFYFGIGLWNHPVSGTYIKEHLVVLSLLSVPLIGLLAYLTYYWFKRDSIKANPTSQAGMVILGIIPLLAIFTVGMLFINPNYWAAIFRFLLILVFCIIPPGMYYLFMVSRKSSLLQEYLSNLYRLGLLEARPVRHSEAQNELENEIHRRIRVSSYMKRFEAVYGPLSLELKNLILDSTERSRADQFTDGFIERLELLSQSRNGTHGDVGRIFTIETLVPVLVATVLICAGWLMVLPPWQAGNNETVIQQLGTVLVTNEQPVLYAFLGAYFFSVQMLFRRYIRNDLRVSAYVSVCLRIILAVIGTWVATKAVIVATGEETQPASSGMLLLGFAIGVFPPIAWQLIRTGLGHLPWIPETLVPSLRSNMPVGELDGLTIWHESRLEEEDIENVPNMASVDLVELFLNTKIPPERIVDWVDQAILYTLIGKNTNQLGDGEQSIKQSLQQHGIRSATALIIATESVNSNSALATTRFEANLEQRVNLFVEILRANTTVDLIRNWRRTGALS